jgi:hypothetical protein
MGWIPECSPTDINNYSGHHMTHEWRLFWFTRHKGGYSENAAFDSVAY